MTARDVACLCPQCACGEVTSPCVQICELDHATKTCRGCSRTLAEIAGWSSFSSYQKQAVIRRIADARQKP
ncbi:MAG: DUF1289 domain-containing protein [Planctomycetes bacterium]|nr:DUF1289 domain-containing protein [Planctomycetota bacterium]